LTDTVNTPRRNRMVIDAYLQAVERLAGVPEAQS